MNKFYTGYKEDYTQVPKIYVVSISDFLDTYNIDIKQKIRMISNYLDNWMKNKISSNSNNNGSITRV